jgi:hypothetical protein
MPTLLPAQQQSRSGFGPCTPSRLQTQRVAALVADRGAAQAESSSDTQRKLKVLIAGAGIGGLVLAVALIKKGVDVAVFERDLTAIRGEGKYRGPIQVGCCSWAPAHLADPPACYEPACRRLLSSGLRFSQLWQLLQQQPCQQTWHPVTPTSSHYLKPIATH